MSPYLCPLAILLLTVEIHRNNGAFWISFQDLMRKYQSFDRTRIFAAEWNLAQQWTTVQVPWTVDYMDTKFEVVLESDAPVLCVP